MAPGFLILGLLQVVLYVISISVFIPSSRNFEGKKNYQHFVKILVSLGVFACFKLVLLDTSIDIFPQEGFVEYLVLVVTSFAFTWFVQLDVFVTNRFLFLLTQWMLGISLWLSLFTCIKFIPIIPLILFPLLGALVIAPYFVLVISIFEIQGIARKKGMSVWLHSGIISLILLNCFQLLMNSWSDEPWELIRLLSPSYHILNF